MEGFIWYKDAIIVGGLFLACLAGLLISQHRDKNKPAPRGATRVQ